MKVKMGVMFEVVQNVCVTYSVGDEYYIVFCNEWGVSRSRIEKEDYDLFANTYGKEAK